jgi:hypothetical protein
LHSPKFDEMCAVAARMGAYGFDVKTAPNA